MRTMKLELEPQTVEGLALAGLISLADQRLEEGRVAERASHSTLYEERWRKAGVDARAIRRRTDLHHLPFTNASDLLQAEKRQPLRKLPCSKVWIWHVTDTAGEKRNWVPYGKQDILRCMGLLARMGRMVGIQAKDLVLAVPPLAPRVTNALPYLWMHTDMLSTHQGLEFLAGSMYMLGSTNWPAFALRKQPTILFCRPGDALTLVEHFAKAAGSPGARPRDLFQRLRAGVFFGEPLQPVREEIQTAYGLEPFDCYVSAEFAGLFAECSAHDGHHVWLDVCIPEIIPSAELAREKADPRHEPQAVFMDEAEPGCEGEFVLTTFGEALPLVRYRTGDLVRLVSTEPCSCGRTHPRAVFPGRL